MCYVYVFVSSCFLFCCVSMLHLTGIPDCSEEDLSVSKALNLRWTTVLKGGEDETQTLINSDEVRTVNYDHNALKM